MPENFTDDVFLSRNPADKPQVRRLAEFPVAADGSPPEEISGALPGRRYAGKIKEGLEQSFPQLDEVRL